MKEIIKEVTTQHTAYQATDGTIFNSAEECITYEESAKGVIRSRIARLITYDSRNTLDNAWTIMGGMDDHNIIAVKMENSEDYKNVCQFVLIECPWLSNDVHTERRESIFETISNAYNADDVVIFGINCENKYYFINSKANLISNLNTLDKESNEE